MLVSKYGRLMWFFMLRNLREDNERVKVEGSLIVNVEFG